MSGINSYGTLIQAVIEAAEDDGAEFAAYLPRAVDLAEKRLFKDLDLPDLEQKASGNLNTGSAVFIKPEGYTFGNFVYITDQNGKRKLLKKRREDFIQDFWPDPTELGEPRYYGDSLETGFLIAPTPDFDYAYEIKYTSKPQGLSTSNQTNYFTRRCSELLYYATVIEMLKFMKAYEQIGTWQQDYSDAALKWNIEMIQKRRDDGANAQGGPNSKRQIVEEGVVG